MYLEFDTFNTTKYPNLEDSYVDKYIPVLYGQIAAMELTPINGNYDTDNGDINAIYRMPDGMSDYGTAYIYVDDTYKTATVVSADYDTGLLTISNGRSSSGSTYKLKLVDCSGYMFDGHCYPREAMQHWYSTYGGIEYTASNFSKTEWESELDDSRYQADFGLLLDDYSMSDEAEDDSSDLDYFNKVIFNMSTLGGKMYARVDYTADGKITARLLDYDRTATDTIQSSEIFDNNSIKGSTSGDTAYAKIKEKYYYNSVDDTYLSFVDSTYSKYVQQNYRKFQTKTDECYLVNESDALERAANFALLFKFIPIAFSIKVKERYYTRLYDVFTIALQPDNLTANTRQYAGNNDCLVTGVSPSIGNGYTTLTVQIIPDRTASTQQVAVKTSAFTTVSREKTATEIVTDDLQTGIDDANTSIEANLLLTGSLIPPMLSLVADKDGNVTDYSDATGTFNVTYSGTDVTGAGPVYSVVSQTGCTGTIDATTGVYAISALSADVGILTLQATYEGLSFETSFAVTKSYTGETGTPGTSISISNPDSTTPETNMVYDNSYYGMYGGQWYMWTWDSETTGYWTLTSATVPTDAVIHYSFDDMPDLPDASGDLSGQTVASLQRFTITDMTTYWQCVASGSDPHLRIGNTGLGITASFILCYDVFVSELNGNTATAEGYIFYTDGTNTGITSKICVPSSEKWQSCKVLLTPTDGKTVRYIRLDLISDASINTSTVLLKNIYIGYGTTSQPIIDNVNGDHNSTQNNTLSTKGLSGKAAYFTGSGLDYIKIPLNLTLTAYTFSFWQDADYGKMAMGSSNLKFYKYWEGSWKDPIDEWYHGASSYMTGRYFFVVTWDGATQKIYVNGSLVATRSHSGTCVFNSNLLLGAFSEHNTSYAYTGIIDDFHFFDYAISASDVLGLYLARGNTQKLYSLADYQNRNIIVTYSISADNTAFSRSRANVISPSTITVSAKQTKLGVLSEYSGRFIIYTTTDSTNYTSVYTSSADESSHTYTLPTTGITGLRVELYKAGGTATLLTSTDYSTPYSEDVAPMYLGLGAISTGTKSFVSATVDSDGDITTGSTISNIITGDWALGYVSTDPKTASVYYWNGTAWTATTAQSYVSAAAFDILNLTTGGYTVANYTVIQDAIIKNLMVSKMYLLTNGVFYGGDRFNANGTEIDTTAKGFWMSAGGAIKALLQSFTGYNVLAGTDAGKYLTQGTGDLGKWNVCNGHQAGYGGTSNSNYYRCVISGYMAGYSALLNSDNNFYGYKSGYENTFGGSNNYYGAKAGYSGTTALRNGAFGEGALYSNIAAMGNNAFGYQAGYLTDTGNYNTFYGYLAGYSNTDGYRNACFGDNTDCYSPTLDYQFNINNTKQYIEFASTAKQNTVYDAITTMANVTSGSISCQGYIGTSVFAIVEVLSANLTFYSNGGVQLGTFVNGSTALIGASLQIEVMAKRTPTNT